MILDRKIGPLKLRAWGLILNFFANGITLFGLSKVLQGQGGQTLLYVGIVFTVILLLGLAFPSRDDKELK